MGIQTKLRAYYFTAILSLVFAVLGFSYNTWRLEVSENNYNIRTACFEVLTRLAELEQVVFAAHYDKDERLGNPRLGWVKVGLINDLSSLISKDVEGSAMALKLTWSDHWETMSEKAQSRDLILASVDQVRTNIKLTLKQLD